MVWAERFFNVVGVGTVASFVKLMGLTFLGKPKTTVPKGTGEDPFLATAMGLLAIVMLIIGIQPQLLMDLFIKPAAISTGLVDLSHLGHVDFFAASAIWDMIITLVIGAAFFGFGMKTNLFHYTPPQWLSVEAAGRQIVRAYAWLDGGVSKIYQAVSLRIVFNARRQYKRMMTLNRKLDFEGGGIFTVLNFSNLNSNAFLILTVLAALVLYYFGSYMLGA